MTDPISLKNGNDLSALLETSGTDTPLNWPWSHDPIPTMPGQSDIPTVADCEAYLDYLMNNSNTKTTYNASLQMLQVMMNLADHYPQMTPAEKESFQNMLQSLSSNGGKSLFAQVIQMAMMGSFYSNGGSMAGFTTTNAFCQQLVEKLSHLEGVSPLFQQMATIAQSEADYVKNTAEQHLWITLNNKTYLTDEKGNLVDFDSYVPEATEQMGEVLNQTQLQQVIQNYYTTQAGSKVSTQDPTAAIFQIMQLLMGGEGDDMNRTINGYGEQLKNLADAQDSLRGLLSLLNKGNMSPEETQQFMQQLTQLNAQIAAYDPIVASKIAPEIEKILGTTGFSVTSNAGGTIPLPGQGPAPLVSQGSIYDFSNLPAGVKVFETDAEGKSTLIYPTSLEKPCYVPAGHTLSLQGEPNTSYTFSVGQLGSIRSVSGTTEILGLGAWKDLQSSLNDPSNQRQINQLLLDVQGVLNAPSSMINTQIQLATAQNTALNDAMKSINQSEQDMFRYMINNQKPA